MGLQNSMKRLAAQIGAEIEYLDERHTLFKFQEDGYRRLVRFRQAAMDEGFDREDRSPEPERGERVREAAADLVKALDAAHGRRFFF